MTDRTETAPHAAAAMTRLNLPNQDELTPVAVPTPTPADPVAKAARVLLADLSLSLDTEAYGKGHPAIWAKAADAADAAPTYNDRPTAIQMIRAALRAITEVSHADD
jgi:hypothetical protein